MAHYAKVLNQKVAQIIVAEPEFFETFVDDSPGDWIQCSYNTRGGKYYEANSNNLGDQSKALRKNYPAVDWTYDLGRDAFIPPKPYPSWTLNEDTCLWECPVEHPQDDKIYRWDEETTNWIEV